MKKYPTSGTTNQKFLAVLLVSAAILGWLISLSGLVLVWASYRPVRQTLTEVLEVTSGALQVSSQTIRLLENSLIMAENSLNEAQTTLNGFAAVMETTSGTLELVSQILEDEFTNILLNTTAAMDGLENTSRLIDGTLSFISSIPFFGGSQYQPEVPLAESIAGIRRDLGEMPAALEQISAQIKETSTGLQPMQETWSNLTSYLNDIQTNLSETRKQMDDYQAIIESYRKQLETFSKILPRMLTGLYIALSILLVWNAFAQIGLWIQGWERLGKTPPPPPALDSNEC